MDLVSDRAGDYHPAMRPRPRSKVAIRTALSGLLALIILVAMLPAAAGAQDPATDAYSGSAPTTASETEPTPVPQEAVPAEEAAPVAVAQPVPSGTVPFTGLELVLMALAGAGVLGLGLLLRRSARSALPGT